MTGMNGPLFGLFSVVGVNGCVTIQTLTLIIYTSHHPHTLVWPDSAVGGRDEINSDSVYLQLRRWLLLSYLPCEPGP